MPRPSLSEQSAELLRDLDALDWYKRCLEDVQDGRAVTGLREAKLGYDAAFRRLEAALGGSDR